MNKFLKNPNGTITKEIVKAGSCCSSSGNGSKPIFTLSGKADPVRSTSSDITFANRWDHLMARLGVKREQHIIEPGLYSMGMPTKESPVFVSANYTLSFDALRSALHSNDCYILVLDTKGINVWCARVREHSELMSLCTGSKPCDLMMLSITEL